MTSPALPDAQPGIRNADEPHPQGPINMTRETRETVNVPREPTREMLNAAIDVDAFKLGDISPLGFRISPQMLFEKCWSAMLAAAPPAPMGEGEAVAWRWRNKPDGVWNYQEAKQSIPGVEQQPLYAAPTPPLGGQGSSDLRPDTHRAPDMAVLASLVAAVSILEEAFSRKLAPNKVVGSDKMFCQMLTDYNRAIVQGRKAVARQQAAVSTDTPPGTSAFASEPNMTPPSADGGVRAWAFNVLNTISGTDEDRLSFDPPTCKTGERIRSTQALVAAVGANLIGAAEVEVGQAVYKRIEALMDSEPQGTELNYLADLVSSVEEYGSYDGPREALAQPAQDGSTGND